MMNIELVDNKENDDKYEYIRQGEDSEWEDLEEEDEEDDDEEEDKEEDKE